MEKENIFQKIIKREVPTVKLYEDLNCIVIMDKYPNTEGQSLVISKRPTDYAFDLDDMTYAHMLLVAKHIAQATDKALKPYRTCLIIEGFEVPQAHIKLYPVLEPKLITTMGPEKSDEELEEVAKKIREFIEPITPITLKLN